MPSIHVGREGQRVFLSTPHDNGACTSPNTYCATIMNSISRNTTMTKNANISTGVSIFTVSIFIEGMHLMTVNVPISDNEFEGSNVQGTPKLT